MIAAEVIQTVIRSTLEAKASALAEQQTHNSQNPVIVGKKPILPLFIHRRNRFKGYISTLQTKVKVNIKMRWLKYCFI